MNNWLLFIFGIVFIVIILSFFSCGCGEGFVNNEFKRKPASKKKVQLGVVTGTPGPLQNLITEIQKLGGQLVADTEYDTVATDYLDPKNIKT